MKKNVYILFLTIFFCSCNTDQKLSTPENQPTIDLIKYGTSFGECVGYCVTNLTISNVQTSYESSSWIDQSPTIKCTENTSNTNWDFYQNTLDISNFYTLDQIIGCPDCADGGSEWIEIFLSDNTSHKVTFEYYNEPNSLKNYIKPLRKLKNNFNNCK